MAFTATVTRRTVQGDNRVHFGTYVSDGGSVGGDINTGLQSCEFITLIPNDTSVEANAPVVNVTLPIAGGVVPIITDANESGYFKAEGK